MKKPWLLLSLIPPTPTYKVWRWFSGEFESFEKAREKAFKLDTDQYDIMNLITGDRPDRERMSKQNLESIVLTVTEDRLPVV